VFEYKETEKFDIGTGYGKAEYDFFTINSGDDFWRLIYHYDAIYRRFNYFVDRYEIIEINTALSPVVQAKMNEYNANLCLTLLETDLNKNNIGIKNMVVNEKGPNGTYKTYIFYFYHFETVRARDYLERGRAYAKSGLHNAAIRYFSRAIKLDPSMGYAFTHRGISYLGKNEYDKAIEDFTQAIYFNSEESEIYSLRGLAYKEAGDFEKARVDFTTALKINPNDGMVKKYLDEINNTI
jgi:tetratricopeptide (TPR) repeat protein